MSKPQKVNSQNLFASFKIKKEAKGESFVSGNGETKRGAGTHWVVSGVGEQQC